MLLAAAAELEARDDRANASQARLVAARRCLLLGRLDDAAAALARVDGLVLPPALAAVAALVEAELALRALRISVAQSALERAAQAAARSGVPALQAEVQEAFAALDRPAARRLRPQGAEPLRLAEVADLLAAPLLVVDGCRRGLQAGGHWLPLARRPVLFALLYALAELQIAGRVRAVGRARAQRWLAPPLAGFTTILLLPASLQPR